ncbi:hypothetical protein G3I40_41180, partial [Streptomyces sp. SID14478]|nr:hypothetical protein [Streptomyces sp. SID14478]
MGVGVSLGGVGADGVARGVLGLVDGVAREVVTDFEGAALRERATDGVTEPADVAEASG